MQPPSGDGQAAPASHDQLAALRQEFPAFRIWREEICDRVRYNACRQQPGLHPHTVVTDDPDEMRAGTCTGTDPELIESLQDAYSGTAPVTGRSQAEIAAWFGGLTLALPGLTDIRNWQPDTPRDPDRQPPSGGRFLAGVGCKPAAMTPVQP